MSKSKTALTQTRVKVPLKSLAVKIHFAADGRVLVDIVCRNNTV